MQLLRLQNGKQMSWEGCTHKIFAEYFIREFYYTGGPS